MRVCDREKCVGLALIAGLIMCIGGVSFADGTDQEGTSNEQLLRQLRQVLANQDQMSEEMQQLRDKVKKLEAEKSTTPRGGWSLTRGQAQSQFATRAEAWLAEFDNGDSNGSNVRAPRSTSLDLSGSTRARWEASNNLAMKDFDDRRHDGQEFTLLRTRLNVDANIEENLSAHVQIQDSREFGEAGSTTGNLARLDLKQGFVTFSNVAGQPVDVSIGRMAVGLGKERLIGRLEWANYGRSYDGVLVNADPTSCFNIKGFAFKIDENFGGSNTDGSAAHGVDNDNNLVGLYGQVRPVEDDRNAVILEPYVIHLRNRDGVISEAGSGRDPQEITTYGLRGELNPSEDTFSCFEGFTLDWEVAIQSGDNGNDDHRAHAHHLGASFQPDGELPGTPKFRVEYNFASGDNDPTDSDSENFNNLFPTNHNKYGAMDLVNWSNMHQYQVGVDLHPAAGWLATIDFMCFMLDKDRAGLMGPRGSIGGGSDFSDDVGKELDFKLRWKATDAVVFESGYSHLFTGQFLKQATSGRSGADWGYVQMYVEF